MTQYLQNIIINEHTNEYDEKYMTGGISIATDALLQIGGANTDYGAKIKNLYIPIGLVVNPTYRSSSMNVKYVDDDYYTELDNKQHDKLHNIIIYKSCASNHRKSKKSKNTKMQRHTKRR